MAEIRFLADAALDCWRFGQHGEGFPLHHWANYELHSPCFAVLLANTCSIITKNEITKGWPTRSFSPVTKLAAVRVRFYAASVWAACFGTIIVTRHSCHLGRMPWAKLTVCVHSANQAEVLVLAARFALEIGVQNGPGVDR